MANTVTNIIPKIVARGLLALREMARMPSLVNRDIEDEARRFGQTVDVPLSSAITATNVAPGPTPPANVDTTISTVPVPLDQWKESPFYLTDKEMREIDASANFIPMQTSEAVRALANAMDSYILSLYTGVYNAVGAAATTPFASNTQVARDARKKLNAGLALTNARHMVLDVDAEANASDLALFKQADQSGGQEGIREGEIGRKLGYDWWLDQNIPTHTAGTFTGTIVTSGAAAVGATSITLATGASEAIAALVGDIIVFAGDTQQYVLTAALTVGASSTGAAAIDPPLKVAQSGGEAVTAPIATHVVNLAFQRDAFAFASRPLLDTDVTGGNLIQSISDPLTGVTLRLEVSRQHKQTKWSFDILYGAALIRPELASRVMG